MKPYHLRNSNGLEVGVIAIGATIVSLKTPDRNGEFADIVLGFDNEQQYLADSPYFGAVVGRYGNRIGGGQFSLDGQTYHLAMNNDDNHLHGGDVGFDKRVWEVLSADDHSIALQLISADGDEGYPGELTATVTYSLGDNNRLTASYHGVTTKPTVVNLTQHSYFNLAGHDRGSILDHEIMINADHFTEVDKTLIPTGRLARVEGTPMDFRTPKTIGAGVDKQNEQMENGGGYDHNWVLREGAAGGKDPAARLTHPKSGRTLTLYTKEPGIQFYSGNFLDGSYLAKDGAVYGRRSGLALETQHFPDSPNQSHFPLTRLDPGQEYETQTIFEFGVDD